MKSSSQAFQGTKSAARAVGIPGIHAGEDVNQPDVELFEERSAIMEYDGGLSKTEAEARAKVEVETHRRACEIRSILAMSDANKKIYFTLVAKHRGDAAATDLRLAVIDAWQLARKK